MSTLPQLRDMEDVVNTRQVKRQFDFVHLRVHTLQHLEWSNIPLTKLAFISKASYAPHWRHLEVHKVANLELKLAAMLIRITFLSALGAEHARSIRFRMIAAFSFVSCTIFGPNSCL
jgi:hypothetical protein